MLIKSNDRTETGLNCDGANLDKIFRKLPEGSDGKPLENIVWLSWTLPCWRPLQRVFETHLWKVTQVQQSPSWGRGLE